MLSCFSLLWAAAALAADPIPEEVDAPVEEAPSLEEELQEAQARVQELQEAMGVGRTADPRLLDPGSGRYLFAPSAIPQPKHHGYFSQKELAFSSVGYGLTDEFSVLGGSVIPAVIGGLANGEMEGLNGIVGLKYSKTLTPEFHMGTGAWALVGLETGFAIPYVNMTYGDRYEHYTVAIGQTVNLLEGEVGVTPIVVATHHATETGAWITETWFLGAGLGNLEGLNFMVAASGAYRFMGKRLTVDLGLINILPFPERADEFFYIPIPWLDFAWHWGPSLEGSP